MSKPSAKSTDVVSIVKALADTVRWQIVERLASGPLSATELGDGFKISAPAISRHLKVLLSGGVVEVATQGRQRVYSLRANALSALTSAIGGLQAAKGEAVATSTQHPAQRSTVATSVDWQVW